MQPVMAALLLLGTIDRIEGSWAVVEWLPSAAIRDVALSACPPGIREGDRIHLVVRAHPEGASVVSRKDGMYRLLTPHGPVGLPDDAPLPSDQRFHVGVAAQRPTPQSPGRAQPAMGTRGHGSMDLRLFRLSAPALEASPQPDRTESTGPASDRPAAGPTPPQPGPAPPPDPVRHPPPDPCTASSHSGP